MPSLVFNYLKNNRISFQPSARRAAVVVLSAATKGNCGGANGAFCCHLAVSLTLIMVIDLVSQSKGLPIVVSSGFWFLSAPMGSLSPLVGAFDGAAKWRIPPAANAKTQCRSPLPLHYARTTFGSAMGCARHHA